MYYNGTACRDHPRGVADAFVELFLLAQSDDLLITFATTFGRVASGLGGTQESVRETWCLSVGVVGTQGRGEVWVMGGKKRREIF